MVLRCSLLGHEYGEPDVEREREERGSEVVVTVQEYEECVRCGDRHLISENTEVRSLPSEADDAVIEPPTPDPASADGLDGAEPDEQHGRKGAPPDVATGAPDGTATQSGPTADETEPPAANPEQAADAPSDETAPDTQPPEPTDSAFPTDEHGDPITDDGVILEDEDDDPIARERGEWPESEDVGPPLGSENNPTDWPEPDPDLSFEDLSTEAELETADTSGEDEIDDAVIVDADDADGATAAAADPTESPAAGGSLGSGTGIERAAAAPTPGESSSLENVPTEFYCPRCGFVAPGNRGSLRTGDICPECRRGYLGERER